MAEVLAYVFQLRSFAKNGGHKPVLPGELDVPPQMDPLNPAFQTAAETAMALKNAAATVTNTSTNINNINPGPTP